MTKNLSFAIGSKLQLGIAIFLFFAAASAYITQTNLEYYWYALFLAIFGLMALIRGVALE